MFYNKLKWTVAVILLISACRSVTKLPVESNFSWLEGNWTGNGYGESWRYIGLEDRMEGTAWKIDEGDTTLTETMQLLYRREKLFFMAQGSDWGPVYFEVSESGDDYFIAENPFHDFPKKIEYRREGAQLRARVSAEDRTESFDFIKD